MYIPGLRSHEEWHGGRWESIFHRWESMGIDFKSILKAFIMGFRGIGKMVLIDGDPWELNSVKEKPRNDAKFRSSE